jgi:hypothetical protein
MTSTKKLEGPYTNRTPFHGVRLYCTARPFRFPVNDEFRENKEFRRVSLSSALSRTHPLPLENTGFPDRVGFPLIET